MGGPIWNVNAQRDVYTFDPCPAEHFENCAATWSSGSPNWFDEQSSGLGLFAGVEESSGFLYLGGTTPGLFGCSLGQLGVVRTDIEIAREVIDDFVPTSNGQIELVTSGGAKSFTIDIDIINDQVVDSALYETFSVELTDVTTTVGTLSASLNPDRKTATVVVTDVNGAGIISVESTGRSVSEFKLSRTGGSRGAVCTEYSITCYVDNTVASVAASTACWDDGEAFSKTITNQFSFPCACDETMVTLDESNLTSTSVEIVGSPLFLDQSMLFTITDKCSPLFSPCKKSVGCGCEALACIGRKGRARGKCKKCRKGGGRCREDHDCCGDLVCRSGGRCGCKPFLGNSNFVCNLV